MEQIVVGLNHQTVVLTRRQRHQELTCCRVCLRCKNHLILLIINNIDGGAHRLVADGVAHCTLDNGQADGDKLNRSLHNHIRHRLRACRNQVVLTRQSVWLFGAEECHSVDVETAGALRTDAGAVSVAAVGRNHKAEVVVGRVDWVAKVDRLAPGAVVVALRHKDVETAHCVVASRAEIQRTAVGVHKHCLLVVLSIDYRAKVDGLTPLVFGCAVAHVDVAAAESARAVAHKVDAAAIGREAGRSLACVGVDGFRHSLRILPFGTFQRALLNVAVALAAVVDEQLLTVGEQAHRSVVELRIDWLANLVWHLPVLILVVADVDVLVVLAVIEADIAAVGTGRGENHHRLVS